MPAPQHCPTPRELDDLELLVTGAPRPAHRASTSPAARSRSTLPRAGRGRRRSSWSTPRACRWRGRRPTGRTAPLEPLTHAAVRPVPPPATSPRPRSASSTPAARSSRSSTRSPTPARGAPRASARVVLLALTGTGTPDLSPVAPGPRHPRRGRRCSPDADVVAVPLAVPRRRRRRPRARRAGRRDYAGRRPGPRARSDERRPARRDRRDRRRTTARRRTSRAWCCSSPACPAAASRRWPAR